MDAGGGHGRGCLARCPLRTLPSGSPAASRQCRPQREPAAVRLDSEGGQRTRAWKARAVPSSQPDATPMAQVGPTSNGPLLTVRDRQVLMPRARGGHGGRGRTVLGPGGEGCQLDQRVRPGPCDPPAWAELPVSSCVAILSRWPRGACPSRRNPQSRECWSPGPLASRRVGPCRCPPARWSEGTGRTRSWSRRATNPG
jgi:hypothetical protein